MQDDFKASAKRLASTKTYWAVVGSGPNKAAADEIRIKLSELCYKTISSDFIEDKKHIDLSSEPLIIVCAAGARSDVMGDIIKDTAIFHAHKATPIVFVDEGDDRFDNYAADIFPLPAMPEHLAPVLNTLAGHMWGYYAALAINEGSRFLYHFRQAIQTIVEQFTDQGLDVYEIILEKEFREKVAQFYQQVRLRKTEDGSPLAIYLSSKLQVADFELDFGKKGTALNMLNTLFETLNTSINTMARPVDAIKHQAKTVTVGTSRIKERLDGILFDALRAHHIDHAQLTNNNIIVTKNLQRIVNDIRGSILYEIEGLNLLGEITEETHIKIIKKEGILAQLPSRVETDTRLKGSKEIIVRSGNVYIGKGRKDDRSIIIIPVISASSKAPNLIDNLFLLNITFKETIPLSDKIKALGGKYLNIKNIVQENSITWEDKLLEMVATEKLFGLSAEKVGEYIVQQVR